ncbi:MAG: bifunctional oligoribonuclease/PAP phosphatase NrnA [Candidatus Peribacteraceae bacterium]|nr:bifunctional oligoribonuclease/PAP phosphatase NrnA [Candidatus Peribacteraceae bacterium]
MSLSPSDVSAVLSLINQHQRILVVPHANVDPDALSSALACYQVFQAAGKDVTVVCPDTPPGSLKFLPGFERMEQGIAESQNFIITVNVEDGVEIDKLRYTVEDKRVNIIVVPKRGKIRSQHISFGEGERKYDLIIVVDTADLALLGTLHADHVDLFSEVPVLNIDHHVSNTRYGQVQLVDPTSASATEVLFQLFRQVPEWRQHLTADVATLLLTGLIADTRSFQNPNTTPRSLEVAAELLEMGARQQEIIQHIYKTKQLSTLKIWGRALNRIQMDEQAGIVWSVVSKEDLQEMGASSQETTGILDELISTVPHADVHVLFTETETGGIKASMRSSNAVDASRLAAETYGGGGHPRAAGFRIRSMGNFQLQVLESIQRLKEGMQRQRAEADVLPPSLGSSLSKTAQQAAAAGAPFMDEKKEVSKTTDVVDAVTEGGVAEGGAGATDVVQSLTDAEGDKR